MPPTAGASLLPSAASWSSRRDGPGPFLAELLVDLAVQDVAGGFRLRAGRAWEQSSSAFPSATLPPPEGPAAKPPGALPWGMPLGVRTASPAALGPSSLPVADTAQPSALHPLRATTLLATLPAVLGEDGEEATTGTSTIIILLDMPESDDCRWLLSDWPVSSGELGNSAGSASLTVKALSSDVIAVVSQHVPYTDLGLTPRPIYSTADNLCFVVCCRYNPRYGPT